MSGRLRYFIMFFCIIICGICCEKDTHCINDSDLHNLGAMVGTWLVMESSNIYPQGQISYQIDLKQADHAPGAKYNLCLEVDSLTSLGRHPFFCFYPDNELNRFTSVYFSMPDSFRIMVNHELTRVSDSRINFNRLEIRCNEDIEFQGVMTKM